MSASLSEPFLLSSYGPSKLLQKATSNGELRRTPSNVYATHEKASGSSDGHVTLAVQGDGVHLLDLSDLHPVVSHTLGPSTTFSCPAISCGKNICTTYAVIESSPDVKPEESGRTVWVWTENLSTSSDKASQKKISVLVPHAVSKLSIVADLQPSVILLSSRGDLSVMDAELNIQNVRTAPTDNCVLLDSFVFSRKLCSFVPTRSAPALGAVITLIVKIGNTIHVQVIALDEEHKVVELGDSEVKVNSDEIASISYSTSGYLSILTHDGSWHSFQLESTDGTSIDITNIAETIQLTSLSFLTSSPPPQMSQQCPDEISLLSLGSSHVLLVAVTKAPAPEIVLLLWDLQYSVLLASQCLAIPAALSRSKDNSIRMDLVATSASQALLLLTPTTSSGSRSSARSSVLVVPYAVPATSTIACAMGRASSGMKWLAQDGSSFAPDPSQLGSRREKLLVIMRSAMEENRPAYASEAFFQWNEQESAILLKGKEASGSGESSDRQPEFSYTFVKQLLDIVLHPSKTPNTPYSSDVLHHLFGLGVVSSNMVEGGLLSALRLRNDWVSIELALKNVRDVSEADIIQVLQAAIARHRRAAAADAMQVDTAPADTSLPKFLSSCVSYTASSASMQLATREHLRDAEDLVCVLDILEGWICTWLTKDLVLLPNESSFKKQNGVFVPIVKKGKSKKLLPPLAKILSFLQMLLDAAFMTLLQHPPAHQIIQKISAHFGSELASIDQIDPLRGPLEPFAKAQARAVRGPAEGGRKEPLVDWRARKRQAQEQSGLAIGLYRLEELVL